MSRAVTDIQLDLDAAYVARRAAMNAEQYATDTGQGSMSVRRNLAEINRTIIMLEGELVDARSSGPISVSFNRGSY